MFTVRLLFTAILTCSFSLYSINQQSFCDNADLSRAQAQEWAISCYTQMTPSELQMTANVIYLLYANALLDTTIQQFFTPISRLSQSILYNMSDPRDPNHELATLRTLVDRLTLITRTRLIYTEILNKCLSYYDNNETNAINSALNTLQLYAQDFICEQADENSTETVKHLRACEDILSKGSQLFQAASEVHKGLSENELPVEYTQENKSLITLSILLQNGQQILNNTNTIVNTVNDLCDHAMKVICLGTNLYKHHYEALYAIIASPSFDQNYATTLFGMYEELSPEYKTLLPDPNHVLEHILKTAKLYTQTEIVQQ